jgi:hypothetical protein
MYRKFAIGLLLLILLPATAWADPPAAPANRAETGDEGEKVLSGMSILGNDDAPKSLVIVPWKSSDMGDAPGVFRVLESGRQPVDRDVFMRELTYYEIRAGHSVLPRTDSN